MEKLKELVDLCKQRQQMFQPDLCGNTKLFNSYDFDAKYQAITKEINKATKSLNIYAISVFSFETDVAFHSLKDLKKFVGNMDLTKTYCSYAKKEKYSVSLYDGELILHCYEDEEHKKAQAI